MVSAPRMGGGKVYTEDKNGNPRLLKEKSGIFF
jgi:hypothetical protein